MTKRATTYGNRQHYAPLGEENNWINSTPPKQIRMGINYNDSTLFGPDDYPGRKKQYDPALYHLNNQVHLEESDHQIQPPYKKTSKSSTPPEVAPHNFDKNHSRSTAIIGKKVYFCYNNPELEESKIERRFKNFGEVRSFYTVQDRQDPCFIYGFATFLDVDSAMDAVSQRVLNISNNLVRVRLAKERNPSKIRVLKKREEIFLWNEKNPAPSKRKKKDKKPQKVKVPILFSFRRKVQEEVYSRHRKLPDNLRFTQGQRRPRYINY